MIDETTPEGKFVLVQAPDYLIISDCAELNEL